MLPRSGDDAETGGPHPQTDACPASPFHVEHLGRQQDIDPFAAEDPLELGRHVGISRSTSCSPCVMTVTRLPKRRYAWANSRPT